MQAIIEGQYRLDNQSQQWAMPGWSGRYWDIITYQDEEELAAYLAGQQPFIPTRARVEPVPFGEEERQRRRQPPPHVCQRCQKPCKPPYRYCYRCHSYLKVKAKISV